MENQTIQYQSIPGNIKYEELIVSIEQGQIKIPQFQRKFVWNIEETAGLIDSILRGYPIGTFIIWWTNDRLRSIRNIGSFNFPNTPEGNMVQYVLDGQQRITSLYVAFKGEKIKDENGRETDYSEIYVNLAAKPNDMIVLTKKSVIPESQLIRLVDLIGGSITLLDKYRDYWDVIEKYQKIVKGYTFSKIDVKKPPIEIATEIFTRINVRGRTLSLFEIMTAKTYDESQNFDLSEKYDALLKELERVHYDTVSASTILQAISVCLKKECDRKTILGLGKQEFIDHWEDVKNALECAIDYLRDFYRIPVSQLLPYDSLLVPLTYYFFKLKKPRPDTEQEYLLQDYFWRSVLTFRFSSATETKLAQDIKRMNEILEDKQPKYDEPVDISVDFIRNHGFFATGSAFIKGMLCLLAYQQPLSFKNNASVRISNDYLKQANSKNYHHFFPKAYMQKAHPEIEYGIINHIGNITIVDDFLNKREIRDNAPSIYIGRFCKENHNLETALNSHMISAQSDWGVFENDYLKFLQNRLTWFSKELENRIIVTQADRIENPEEKMKDQTNKGGHYDSHHLQKRP